MAIARDCSPWVGGKQPGRAGRQPVQGVNTAALTNRNRHLADIKYPSFFQKWQRQIIRQQSVKDAYLAPQDLKFISDDSPCRRIAAIYFT